MTRERDRILANANKYIIKNCPCYINYENKLHLCCDGQGEGECQECTDCVIKLVIEKCKGTISNYSNLEILRDACETSEAYGKANIAEQILQLFDIEEVRE